MWNSIYISLPYQQCKVTQLAVTSCNNSVAVAMQLWRSDTVNCSKVFIYWSGAAQCCYTVQWYTQCIAVKWTFLQCSAVCPPVIGGGFATLKRYKWDLGVLKKMMLVIITLLKVAIVLIVHSDEFSQTWQYHNRTNKEVSNSEPIPCRGNT